MKAWSFALVMLAGCVQLPKEGTHYPAMPVKAEPVDRVEPTVSLPPPIDYEKPVKEEKWLKVNIVRQFNIMPCDGCNRTGRFRCQTCAGTGILYAPTGLQNAYGEWVQETRNCTTCEGIGSLAHAECQGLGKVVVER